MKGWVAARLLVIAVACIEFGLLAGCSSNESHPYPNSVAATDKALRDQGFSVVRVGADKESVRLFGWNTRVAVVYRWDGSGQAREAAEQRIAQTVWTHFPHKIMYLTIVATGPDASQEISRTGLHRETLTEAFGPPPFRAEDSPAPAPPAPAVRDGPDRGPWVAASALAAGLAAAACLTVLARGSTSLRIGHGGGGADRPAATQQGRRQDSTQEGTEPERLFNLGMQLERHGDGMGAEAAHQRADEAGHAEAATRRGLLMEQRGDPVAARAAYRRGAKRGDPAATVHLARLLKEHEERRPPAPPRPPRTPQRRERPTQAAASHQAARGRVTESSHARRYRREGADGDAETARRTDREARLFDPKPPAFRQSTMYGAEEDSDLAYYLRKDAEGDPEAAFRAGLLLEQAGDIERAEAAFRRADERGHACGATEVGRLLEHRGDWDGAEAAYRRGAERGDAVGADVLGLPFIRAGESARHLSARRLRPPSRAISQPWPELASYLQQDAGGDAGAAFKAGVLLERHGDFDEAEAAFRRADMRGYASGSTALGRLLEGHGDLDGAEAAFGRADGQGHGPGATGLARLLEKRGDLEGAKAAFRRAMDRGHGAGATGLGRLLERQGDLEGAEAAFRRASDLGHSAGATALRRLLYVEEPEAADAESHDYEIAGIDTEIHSVDSVSREVAGLADHVLGKEQALARFRSFRSVEADQAIARIDADLPLLQKKRNHLKARTADVDRAVEAPLAELRKYKSEIEDQESTISRLRSELSRLEGQIAEAERIDEKISSAGNSYERAMLHEECEQRFGDGKPGRVIHTTRLRMRPLSSSIGDHERQIDRIRRDMAKTEQRITKLAAVAARDIDALIIDGNNCCYQDSDFIGLAALIPMTENLGERYAVTVVFDAAIRRLLRVRDDDLRAALPAAKVHVVASRKKADETILDAADEPTAWVVSNDRFGEYRDKTSVKDGRVIRHEILRGRILVHDLGVNEPLAVPSGT
jgi:tetratricopeptide (TPR) repeat protein